MRTEESREAIGRALAGLGWEVRRDRGPEAIVAGYGRYHLMVSFVDEEPASILISYVGKGGEMLSRRWPGVERLPSPERVVRALS